MLTYLFYMVWGISMALPQQKTREIVFQILYSQDVVKIEDEDIIPFIMSLLMVTKKSVLHALEKCHEIREKVTEIDALVQEVSTSYDFDRIPLIERNILRLAIHEILFEENVPGKVAIAEAIRLARKFSTPESATFINAVVDPIYQRHLLNKSASKEQALLT